MNGPAATAGLMPNLSRIIGVIVPISEASITTENNATETTIASVKSVRNRYVNEKTNMEMIMALSNATMISLNKR